VRADHPDVRLVSDASGRANWNFGVGPAGRPAQLPRIDRLIVSQGALRFDDARRRLSFRRRGVRRRGRTGGGRRMLSIEGRLTRGSADWAGRRPSAVVPRLIIQARLGPLAGGL